MTSIEPMNLESEDLVADRIEQLKQLFPEIITEGEGSVDFEKLRLIMGDEVNEDDERYVFTWPGKRDAIRQSQTPSTATLRPVVDESCGRDGEDGSFDSDNLYIEGDNLEVLKLLQHSYHGKVKMIYIDPPYNTGHDFVYKDSFGDTIGNYKQQARVSGQSNANTSGRYHSDWCSMMYPRLKLARELLCDEGIIVVSIDDRESDNLRKILDEIFGEACFVCAAIWRSSDNSNNDAKQFSSDHNLNYIYSKCADWSPRRQIDVAKQSHFKNPDNDPRGAWFDGNPLNSPNHRENLIYDLVAPNGTVIHPPKNGWRWSKETLYEKLKTGEIYFNESMTNIKRRTYLADMKGLPPSSLWIDFEKTGHNRQGKYELLDLMPEDVFDTPKPTKLIIYILDLLDFSDDDMVLDFFSGAATTAVAVMKKNAADSIKRRVISIQLPEDLDESLKVAGNDSRKTIEHCIKLCETNNVKHYLSKIGMERIRRVGAKIVTEIEESNRQLKLSEEPKPVPDIGFRVFRLDESGVNKQDLNAAAERGELFGGDSLLDSVVKPNRSDMDIVFEMMLKWGLELTLPVGQTTIAGYKCYVVSGGELICCMEQGLTVEVLEAVADIEPRRVLMLDSILTDTLKLNAVQIFKRVGDRTGVEVELRTV